MNVRPCKLHYAARRGVVSEVSTLLKDHPAINVNRTDTLHWTPLQVAYSYGHSEVVKLLLAHPDINVNVKGGIFIPTPEVPFLVLDVSQILPLAMNHSMTSRRPW